MITGRSTSQNKLWSTTCHFYKFNRLHSIYLLCFPGQQSSSQVNSSSKTEVQGLIFNLIILQCIFHTTRESSNVLWFVVDSWRQWLHSEVPCSFVKDSCHHNACKIHSLSEEGKRFNQCYFKYKVYPRKFGYFAFL